MKNSDQTTASPLPNDADVTDTIVARLSERLQEPVRVSEGNLLEISAAIGRCSTRAPVLNLNDLLRDSDHAMYQSKKRIQKRNTLPTMLGIPSSPSTSTIS